MGMERRPWQIWAEELGRKLLDAGNIALGALIFGQLVSRQPFSWKLALGGLGAWFLLVMISLAVISWSRGEQDDRD